jgi:ribulose-phosphate 3-epimerase
MKREIIPVILAKSFADFKKKLGIIKKLRPRPKMIQIDVVDGKFAPFKTYNAPERVKKILKGMNFEVDLMVVDPVRHAADWIKAGAKRILFHIESAKDPRTVIALAYKNKREVGLSLNPDHSSITRLLLYRKEIDAVLLLGVRPGKSGQKFHRHVLKKIQAFHRRAPTLPIEVDGGVNLVHAEEMFKAGATRLAAASAIMNAKNPQDSYQQLLKISNAKHPRRQS